MSIYFLYFKHDHFKKIALKFILFKNMTLFIKLDRIQIYFRYINVIKMIIWDLTVL